MSNLLKTLTGLIALLAVAVAHAQAANDSVHNGTGRELLDNITPNALSGGGGSGGGNWTGYEHLKGRSLDTGWIDHGSWPPAKRINIRVLAKIDTNGTPYIRCMANGGLSNDSGWFVGEVCIGPYHVLGKISPRGVTLIGNSSGHSSIPW